MRLKHFLSVFLTLLTLSIGQMWATHTVIKAGDMVSGQKYIIAAETSYYLIPNSYAEGASGSLGTYSSNLTETAAWTFTKSGEDWNISTVVNNKTVYLGHNGKNNGVRTNASAQAYTISATTSGASTVYLVANSRYLSCTPSNSNWRCYGNTNTGTVALTLYRVDAATTPTITKSSSMTEFGCNLTTGVPNKQSFTVSGTNLKAAIDVTPPSGYEISTSENGTYQSTAISLSKNGSNAVATTTIWVRLKEDNTSGSYSGNITCTSTDATTQNVAVSGSTPFKVTWIANNDTETPYATTYVAYASGEGTALGTLPTDPDPDDYCGDVFYGWHEGSYKNASVAPSIVTTSTKITEDKTYNAVFADEVDGGSATKYKLVSSLTSGKDYIFVNRNTAGSGYALSSTFSSNQNTGSAVSIVASGDDLLVSGTPANSIIWTAATGWSLTTKDNTQTNTKLKINGSTFALDATGSSNLAWTTNYGLNGKSSGTTKYYVQCSNGTFTKSSTSGSTTNRVWAYEKTNVSVKTQSNFTTSCCTPLGQINGSFFRYHFLANFGVFWARVKMYP